MLYVITTILLASFLGYITNYIAIKMLFYPREPLNLYLFKVQGVFPKRQAMIAAKIGKMVADELLSVADIQEKLNMPENIAVIHDNLEDKLDEFLAETFPEKYPVMSFFVREKTRSRIKEEVLTEVTAMAPEVMLQCFENIEENLDIEQIIRDRVETLEPEKLEALIMSVLESEFKFIEYVGAVIGFVIGIVQVIIVKSGLIPI